MSMTPRRGRATAIGLIAVLLWAALALFTAMSGGVPPFLLTALCFAIGGSVGLVAALAGGAGLRDVFGQRPAVWALGVGGLFGYHFFYFTALRNAPVAEAGLIAYLWPLLIVLFSGLLPGERLRPLHFIGAGLGFAGAALLILDGGGVDFSSGSALGYGAAGLCALIWSGYSVLSRRFGEAPTAAVAGFCLVAAALGALAHIGLGEPRIWPQGPLQWGAVLALGLGPVGGAFYAWDHGVKRGDIQLLGVASYAAPLLSTLLLVALGFAEPSGSLALACALIAGGAGLAALASRGGA